MDMVDEFVDFLDSIDSPVWKWVIGIPASLVFATLITLKWAIKISLYVFLIGFIVMPINRK